MKYILNETPIKTTNGFQMNNISLDLDLTNKELSNIEVSDNKNIIVKKEIKSNYISKIGIKHDKFNFINIDVIKDAKNINIDTNLNTNYLVSEININLKENTSSSFIINITGEGYNNLKIKVNAKDNSSSKLLLINNLSKTSKSFISFENELGNNSNLTTNFIDLGGEIRLSNYYSKINEYSTDTLNNIHIGKNKDIIDMNYHMESYGKKSNSNIEVAGALFDETKKSFKGIIDFKEGSDKAIGYENENELLFSDKAVSKSLPMLLCHEEDVSGTHSVSTGKVDENKLFYLMSKGINEKEANKLIMYANFNKILENIDNKEDIIKLIEEKMN